ncbi:hypothetical protein PGT21_028667 [Puccinia graminis f. sp. tritici]|uniref:Ig-like domain-containing protein n=1 Tax=Puccinia graminis f. sp. tritici TaxID=56615 RepID=A0A5B0S054_PUCGR|nr:hypothetical protein PGT21_028667 [Puccinia graminis f. sp. tritici]KAA1131227.1 hypothetical protein PGTUg99_025657 [Puccinia graminis f. sp. tritici]
MNFVFLSLTIITLISQVCGILFEEVFVNSKSYYVFNEKSIISPEMPYISALHNQPFQQGDILKLNCKNNTNSIVQVWTGLQQLIKFKPNEEKTISWRGTNNLMVLTTDNSSDIGVNIYLEAIHSCTYDD